MLRIVDAHGNNLKHVDGLPVGLLTCITGVSGRQVDADQRHAVSRGRAPPVRLVGRAGAARGDRGPRALRQGDQRRPVADRSHAALEPGHVYGPVHADPRAVLGRADLEGARLRSGPFLVQREGRPLRIVPGRRRAEGGNALPAGRLRAVRRVPRQALQPRNARSAVQGQEHQRSARHDGRARVRILQRGAGHRAQAEDAARRRPRLHPPRPVGHDAVGRRGAAREAVARSPSATPAARCTSSTSRPPACTSTTSPCCWK